MGSSKTIRIGAGSAHEGDDIYGAQILAERGDLDYIVFDCQSEVALSKAFLRRENGIPGYDVLFEAKLRKILPACVSRGTKIIANAGILDPKGAAVAISKVCSEMGYGHLKVAYVSGGEVTDQLRQLDPVIADTNAPLSAFGNAFLGAVAYGGAREIVAALAQDADIVITPRAGDSEQYLAAMMHEFGWSFDDWEKIGRGLGLGHLVECSAQVTGGCYADPGRKDVDGLERLGFPILEVEADGSAVISKVEGTGGVINEQTCREQLVYEIGDPSRYIHADAIVDFTTTTITQVGPDRVRIEGTGGKPKTDTAKIGLAVREGYIGVGRLLFGGVGALEKARLAAEICRKQLVERHGFSEDRLRFDFIGFNALFDWGTDPDAVREVELRVSGRAFTRAEAADVMTAVSLLPCNGPAGVFWPRPTDQGGIEEIMGYHSTLLPQDAVRYEVHVAN
ncbi:acyclic terpene utilization AtuA family protein [Shinella sp. S4-D37]|uniref:acyclic terpene utilization AtuA family protein n=1 Tax=Shinella sp. S4-D37 TaxID=3161999 RepID=UPI003465F0A1